MYLHRLACCPPPTWVIPIYTFCFLQVTVSECSLNWLPLDHVVPMLTYHFADVFLGRSAVQLPTADVSQWYSNVYYPSMYVCMYLSICLSIYLSIYLFICLSIYLSIYLSICLSVCLSVNLSIYRSSIYPSIYPSVYLSIYLGLTRPPMLTYHFADVFLGRSAVQLPTADVSQWYSNVYYPSMYVCM